MCRAEEAGRQQRRIRIPLTFLHNSSDSLDPPLLPLLPPRAPTSPYFSPALLSSENRPEARRSPGWLAPWQSPCSSHAGNNLSLLKEPRLLEGSTRTPPPPPPPPLTLSEASGLLPRRRHSTRLHVPPPLPPLPPLPPPGSSLLTCPPSREAAT